MSTIWKFPILITDCQKVDMPAGASVLCVQIQIATPCLWAIVDAEAPKVERWFRIYGTGHPMNKDSHAGNYVGTFQYGPLVFHVFENV